MEEIHRKSYDLQSFKPRRCCRIASIKPELDERLCWEEYKCIVNDLDVYLWFMIASQQRIKKLGFKELQILPGSEVWYLCDIQFVRVVF